MNTKIILPTEREISFSINYSKLVIRKKSYFRDKILNLLLALKWVKWDIEEVYSIKTTTIDHKRFLDFFMSEMNKIHRMYNIEELILIVGSKQFQEVTDSLVTSPFMFKWSEDFRESTLCGLITCVLPWIDGCVLVPKEYWPLDVRVVEKIVPLTPELADDERKKQEGIRAADAWNRFLGRKITETYIEEDEE